tara:strand:+ start:30 stop:263 length:234 start_codon:yes stop_codon:yes gene_type:complete
MTTNHIVKIIGELFDLNADQINTEIKINELENWDSLKYMQLIIRAEEELEVMLSADEISNIVTINDLVDLCSKKTVK